MHGQVIKALLKDTEIIKIVDRDDRSPQEIAELDQKGIRVLHERNIESYMLDDEVIKKLCESVGKVDEYENCIKDKAMALEVSKSRGNAADDCKSARGEIYNALKKRLALTKCGNNSDSFIRDTLCSLITPDMNVYKKLEEEIFGRGMN